MALGLAAVGLVGCAAIAGVSDYAVDPCFEGCADAPNESAMPDSAPPDAPLTRDTGSDAPANDASDASDAADIDAAPPPSPGQSFVTLSGTGVAVGKTGIIMLIARDDAGAPIARTGANVVFTTSGGTSVVTFGAVTDNGDGTYKATFTGVTQGTKLSVSAKLDAAPLTSAPASLRVVNAVATGLTFSIDASNADRAGNFGGKNCVASGLTQWTDLGTSQFAGTLLGFADPCAALSGWAGVGLPDDAYRLTFDGVDDLVDFGAVNALQKYTVLAWIRKTGTGFVASTAGGLTDATPILAKGTAEGESDALDIDYFLAIASTGQLASDYEGSPGSGNNPLTGMTVLADNTWYMVGVTLDASTATRSLWLNGAVDGSVTPTLPPPGSASTLFVVGGAKRSVGGVPCNGVPGASGCGRFQGDIAAVLTYDHVLTQSEIEQNCHSFSSRFGMTTCPN
jgi:hypothetical protein